MIILLTSVLYACQKLEKLQEENQIEKPFQRKQMKFRFPERGRSGRSVIMVKNLEFGYSDKVNLLCFYFNIISIVSVLTFR